MAIFRTIKSLIQCIRTSNPKNLNITSSVDYVWLTLSVQYNCGITYRKKMFTINLIRESQINAAKSAYHQLHCREYGWNSHPMAPPGSRGVIYEDTDSRLVWVTQGTVAWYIRLPLNHYRVLCWFIPEINGLRFSSLLYFLPQYCLLP